jgi:hypothetical protein
MSDSNSRIWFTGIPGSKWSGVDTHLRQVLSCDRTDETVNRTQYHRPVNPTDTNNGHRGSYFGPGMGCGEDWDDFNYLKPHKLIDDINNVFHGEGYRVIKSHFMARHFNLDYVWNHFPDDWMVLIYREPQKSFAWWSEVMDFDEDHYPDYRPGYKNYDRMHDLLWRESAKITDFAIRKNIKFYPYTGPEVFAAFPGYKYDVAVNIPTDVVTSRPDVYIGIARIPR